jgi:hypothetical protein
MGWAYGIHKSDRFGEREVGYGVEAPCDYTGCMQVIDRGLDYRCGGADMSEPHGCGDFFCHDHLFATQRRPQRCPWCCHYSRRRVAEIQQRRRDFMEALRACGVVRP